jgi:uncharacterized membrane protein YGL010W
MKTLEQQMSVYAAYHRNPWNRATHFIGVPAIIVGLLIPMCWVPLGGDITLAHLFVGAVLVWYFRLDIPLALAMTVATGLMLYAAQVAAAQNALTAWIWFGVLFGGGWVFQLVGHVFEGRKPALADNFFQIFVAPIFLMAEVFFALGYKKDVSRRVEELLPKQPSA